MERTGGGRRDPGRIDTASDEGGVAATNGKTTRLPLLEAGTRLLQTMKRKALEGMERSMV